MPRIAIILAPNSRFSANNATSIDLCVVDSVRYSRYREDITVFGPDIPAPYDDVTFAPVPREKTAMAYWTHLRKALGAFGPDLLEIHQHMKTASHLARRFSSVPSIGFRHNHVKEATNPVSLISRSFRLWPLDKLAFVSEFTRREFMGRYPRLADKAVTALNGLDAAAYQYSPENKQKIILYAGRVIPTKGVHEFIEAAGEVLPDYPDWRAVIVGGTDRGFESYVAQAEAKATACGPQVSYLGFRPYHEVMGLFEQAEIAAVPSNWDEPFGRTALEAMACGAALISSGRGGLREVSGKAALYLDAVTPGDIAGAMRTLIEQEDLRKQLQRDGRHRAETVLDIRRTVSAIDDLRADVMA